MSLQKPTLLNIPESLRQQLLAFRRRVWTVKLIEAVATATAAILCGYLAVFLLDRMMDTPREVRWSIWLAAVVACGLIPLALERWIWRNRRLEQLARLLSRRHPSVGDQLLGIIELSHNASEQARSPVLVQAAIEQVSQEAARRDFRDSVPRPRHRQRALIAGLLGICAGILLFAVPAASGNAWARFLLPWNNTHRFTFAAVTALPERLVVPHGESFPLSIQLTGDSQWKPASGQIQLPGQPPLTATLRNDAYAFELPGQISPGSVQVRVGDFSGEIPFEPMLRPQLSSLGASVALPEYLGRTTPLTKDIRGGSMNVVQGSQATVTATISRKLSTATVDQQLRTPSGATFSTATLPVTSPRDLQLDWKDEFGLSAEKPFHLSIQGIEDEAPSLVCENLPRQQILLDSEVLTFQIRARDDFGVKRVGIEWKGLDDTLAKPARGEKLIGAGDFEAELLDLTGTFSATQLEISPQPIGLRVFVEDYYPDRERVYSPMSVLQVLNAEQHAIWVTEQLSRWHRMSLEIRDRELQLHEVNKQLRSLPTEELDLPETRRRIDAQAAAERANGRRLSTLITSGESILKQAMRNPEIGVGHLDRWAEMMQILKEISANRMPSVADLLKQASQAPQVAEHSKTSSAPRAGQNRANASGTQGKKGEQRPVAQIPTISDIESTQNSPKPEEPKDPTESKNKQPRLTLPETRLAGNGSAKKKPTPAGEKVDEAVRQQQDLLAEFEKIADELNTVLANLEGTTLVKRLKASARRQGQVAARLGSLVPESFGIPTRRRISQSSHFDDLENVEVKSSQDVSNIMDDMAAYFERSRFQRFKVVLDDMREQDVTAGLRNLSEDLKQESGLSIAQAEYWSGTLDRWAEDLVEVTKCGACPGCKSKGSLPPSIVLEVLQILEGEMNLREETRVAEQARAAISTADHRKEATRLSESQSGFQKRIDKVIARIRELPDAEADFGKELRMLAQVSQVMTEATEILARPETGRPAIGAETEAIELLLKSKRFNPNGGGGGGPDPGGGGGGTTERPALALVGTGLNAKEVREDHGAAQSTGTSGAGLPEEFRAGLDEYFNQLEASKP